jgi:hypothetical protein
VYSGSAPPHSTQFSRNHHPRDRQHGVVVAKGWDPGVFGAAIIFGLRGSDSGRSEPGLSIQLIKPTSFLQVSVQYRYLQRLQSFEDV